MSRAKRSVARDIAIQRAYEDPTARDGYRVLVDRFWPRGRSKDVLKLDEWARDLAPSAELVRRFHAESVSWEEFRSHYREGLSTAEQGERLRALLAAAKGRRVTLVYGARDATHNQAVVLREVLLAMPEHGVD